jgi:hypothetical protein
LQDLRLYGRCGNREEIGNRQLEIGNVFNCHKLPRVGVLTTEQRRRAEGGWNWFFKNWLLSALKLRGHSNEQQGKFKTRSFSFDKISPRDREMLNTLNRSINLRIAS